MFKRLDKTAGQIIRKSNRLINRRRRPREGYTLHLIAALVVSGVKYSLSYHYRTRKDNEQMDAQLRKACKTALGLSARTCTPKVLQLGTDSTLPEHEEALVMAQTERLLFSAKGSTLLARLGYDDGDITGDV